MDRQKRRWLPTAPRSRSRSRSQRYRPRSRSRSSRRSRFGCLMVTCTMVVAISVVDHDPVGSVLFGRIWIRKDRKKLWENGNFFCYITERIRGSGSRSRSKWNGATSCDYRPPVRRGMFYSRAGPQCMICILSITNYNCDMLLKWDFWNCVQIYIVIGEFVVSVLFIAVRILKINHEKCSYHFYYIEVWTKVISSFFPDYWYMLLWF